MKDGHTGSEGAPQPSHPLFGPGDRQLHERWDARIREVRSEGGVVKEGAIVAEFFAQDQSGAD